MTKAISNKHGRTSITDNSLETSKNIFKHKMIHFSRKCWKVFNMKGNLEDK